MKGKGKFTILMLLDWILNSFFKKGGNERRNRL